MFHMSRVMIETEQVFAGMLVVGIVGYLMNGAMVVLETKATPWTH